MNGHYSPALPAPRAAPPPSRIPTEQLSVKADSWLGGTSNTPAPASVPQNNNAAAFIRQNYSSPLAQPNQPQQQPTPLPHSQYQAMQQPPQQSGLWDNRASGVYSGNGMAPAPPQQQQIPVMNQYQGAGGVPAYQYQPPPQQAPVQQNYGGYPGGPPPGAGGYANPAYLPPTPLATPQLQQPYQVVPPPQNPYYAPPPNNTQQPSRHLQTPSLSSSTSSTLSLSGLSLNPPPTSSTPSQHDPRRFMYPSPEEAPPHKLAVTHPDQKMLSAMRETALAGGGGGDMSKKVAWAKQVLKFIERHQSTAGESSRINDPTLVRWTDEALTYILTSAASATPVPLALYLRGDLSSSGSFPSYRTKDQKSSFRDFESAANAGYEKAWFRIGRAYEDFGDVRRAVGAYERGIEKGDCGSTYRLAMAYLLGQIGLTPDSAKAIALLKRAADQADLDTPQPPYILGMILSGEFESPVVQIKKDIVPLNIEEAKWRIERAAYLSFGPAQYKMGFSYEYATLGCLFDPLLSVQYYALASQNGEVEADMALSKWYLVGSEGNFDKDESLSFTFAEKAATRQLPSAEFALGYYCEVGINGMKNLDQAKRWYARAAGHGNVDARDRLDALGVSETNALSRVDHESHVDSKLVRKRTQAQVRSNEQRERMAASNLAASLTSGGPPPRSSSYASQQQQQQPQPQVRRQNTRKAVETAAQMVGGRNPLANSGGNGSRPSSIGSGPSSQQQRIPSSQQPAQNFRPSPAPTPQQSSPSRPTGGKTQQQQVQEIPVAVARPTTFAEMGIATQKAKKDECVIM